MVSIQPIRTYDPISNMGIFDFPSSSRIHPINPKKIKKIKKIPESKKLKKKKRNGAAYDLGFPFIIPRFIRNMRKNIFNHHLKSGKFLQFNRKQIQQLRRNRKQRNPQRHQGAQQLHHLLTSHILKPPIITPSRQG